MGSSTADTARDHAAISDFLIAAGAWGYMKAEHLQHSVHIGRSFGMGKYPVTR